MKSKWLKRGAWMLVWVVSLGALFYAEENWRGARAWKAYEAELRAKGEPLTIREMLPERPPDELNMAMAPAFAMFLEVKQVWDETKGRLVLVEGDLFHKRKKLINLPIGLPGPIISLGIPTELGDLRQACDKVSGLQVNGAELSDAAYLIKMLDQWKGEISEVEQAVERPFAYWPNQSQANLANYGIYYLHTTLIAEYAKWFRLRAISEIHESNYTEAYRDLMVLQKMTNVVLAEASPSFFSYMMGVGQFLGTHRVIWEGLHRQSWKSDQLESIQSWIRSVDLSGSWLRAVRGDRALVLSMTIFENKHYEITWSEFSGSLAHGDSPYLLLYYFLFMPRPQGWYDRDRVAYAKFIQECYIDGYKSDEGSVVQFCDPLVLKRYVDSKTSVFSRWVTPVTNLADLDFVRLNPALYELQRRQALVACELEKIRLRKGSFPVALSGLALEAWEYEDPYTDEDMIYRREGDGYILYTKGKNGRDDGGKEDSDDQVWRMTMWVPK